MQWIPNKSHKLSKTPALIVVALGLIHILIIQRNYCYIEHYHRMYGSQNWNEENSKKNLNIGSWQ